MKVRATIDHMNSADLRRLLAEATPGPWDVMGPRARHWYWIGAGVEDDPADDLSLADAKLITATVNALPALLDRMEKLEKVADLVRTKQCCDGRDAETTREAREALAVLDAEKTP